MAELATNIAEVLLTIRVKLIRIIFAIVILWALIYAFVADEIISKIESDLLPEGAETIYTYPLEGLILKLKISLVIAFVCILPYIIRLTYKTLKERTELLDNIDIRKTTAIKYAIVSVTLFALGVAYGYVIMLPLFMKFLYQSAVSQGVTPMYTISEFIGFIVLMLTIFGLVFQMPIVMLFLVGNDIVEFETLKYYRRHFYVAFFVIGAAITPPDVFTQAMVALPMIAFFEISLLSIRIIHRKKIKSKER
ncbi:preprotein translocase subunit TatC [Archaeoglobales archaeon]|nr:MAG: preprotein translocase subunit TatC [Archaeoglobales archaeon]